MNLANDFHPIHLHLIQFQLFNRQAFDVKAYEAALAQAPDCRLRTPRLISRASPWRLPRRKPVGRTPSSIGRHGHPDRDPMGAPNRSITRAGQSQARG